MSKLLGTSDAAKQLGISQTRVSALIRQGMLKAERVGNVWVVDRASLEVIASRGARGRVRALEARDAWAIAASLDGAVPEWVSRSRLSGLLSRVEKLTPDDSGAWGWLMSRRAIRSIEVQIHHEDLPRLLEDLGIRKPDLSTVPGEIRVEGGRELLWASCGSQIRLLQRPEVLASSRPNVVIRTWPRELGEMSRIPSLVASADLLEEPDSRSRRAGAWLFRRGLYGPA